MAHARALGDEVPQALVVGLGAGGRGALVAAAGRLGQVYFWSARQAIAPTVIPAGEIVISLQPILLRERRAGPVPSIRTTDG